MSEPFLSEIKIVAFNFPPRGWAFCDGQILPISQNQALYSLLGTTYGGDGRVTFALPDLRGRAAIGFDQSHPLGQKGGEETHTLIAEEMPTHAHTGSASSVVGDSPIATNNLVASSLNEMWGPPNNLTAMNAGSISTVGGSQPHENRQPLLVLAFCIALQGLFPSPN